MKLKSYLELVKKRPYKWADENQINRSRVYDWINKGVTPDLDYVLKIKKITDGAVGPDDWDSNAA